MDQVVYEDFSGCADAQTNEKGRNILGCTVIEAV
jgi:hypothetical protein